MVSAFWREGGSGTVVSAGVSWVRRRFLVGDAFSFALRVELWAGSVAAFGRPRGRRASGVGTLGSTIVDLRRRDFFACGSCSISVCAPAAFRFPLLPLVLDSCNGAASGSAGAFCGEGRPRLRFAGGSSTSSSTASASGIVSALGGRPRFFLGAVSAGCSVVSAATGLGCSSTTRRVLPLLGFGEPVASVDSSATLASFLVRCVVRDARVFVCDVDSGSVGTSAARGGLPRFPVLVGGKTPSFGVLWSSKLSSSLRSCGSSESGCCCCCDASRGRDAPGGRPRLPPLDAVLGG